MGYSFEGCLRIVGYMFLKTYFPSSCKSGQEILIEIINRFNIEKSPTVLPLLINLYSLDILIGFCSVSRFPEIFLGKEKQILDMLEKVWKIQEARKAYMLY